MKKTLTLLIFILLTNGMLFGQCPDTATPNTNGARFNMNYVLQADRDAAWNALVSITFPLAAGGTITILKADLEIDGPVGTSMVYRIRRNAGDPSGTFGGGNPFTGSITFDMTTGPNVICDYVNTMFSGSSLPVELISFDGIKKDRQINLNWKTASEINNEGFVIERGHKVFSGLEWNRLDFVEGNGTTQELQIYSFTDQNPIEGTNYYRLKQMDYDGKYEYSSIIAVEYSSENGNTPIVIFPNPIKDKLILINGSGKATIFNSLGQPVKHLTIDTKQATIQLANLLNGQYYIQVLQENGNIVMKQFSKVD